MDRERLVDETLMLLPTLMRLVGRILAAGGDAAS
jgi:hypothetical protein